MRKGKPATLSPSLLARKGEAEPSRLGDGSVPKDVIELQEELVARVAAQIKQATSPEDETRYAYDRPAPVRVDPLPVARPMLFTPAPVHPVHRPTAAPIEPPREPDMGSDEADEIVEEALSDEAPSSAEAKNEEPDPSDATIEDEIGTEASQVPLAAWTAREEPRAMTLASEHAALPSQKERSRLLPFVLGVAIVTAGATFAIWHISNTENTLPEPGLGPLAEAPQAPATTPATAPSATPKPPVTKPVSAGTSVVAAAPSGEAAPSLGPTQARPAHHAAAPVPARQAAKAPTPPATAVPPAAKVAAAPPAGAPGTPPSETSASAGAFVVQLLSADSEAAAQNAWAKLSTRLSASATAHPHEIVRADLGKAGIRYRLRLTGFPSDQGAKSVCQSLKAKQLACLVTRR